MKQSLYSSFYDSKRTKNPTHLFQNSLNIKLSPSKVFKAQKHFKYMNELYSIKNTRDNFIKLYQMKLDSIPKTRKVLLYPHDLKHRWGPTGKEASIMFYNGFDDGHEVFIYGGMD